MTYSRGLKAAAKLAEELADEEVKYRHSLPALGSFDSSYDRSEGAENALRDLAQQLKALAKKSWV